MDLPDRNDLFAVGRRYIKTAPNTRINPIVVDVPGSDVNLVVGSGALQGEAIVAAFAKCVRGLFIGTAKGDQLDRIIYDRFGITRKPASAATVDVILIRPTFAGGGGTIPAGTRMTTASGSIFALQTDVVFGATDIFRGGEGVAQIVGPTQNIPVLTLTAFVDQPFDATITVTNFTPAAGGTDAENDPTFRGRAYQFFQVLRRGILGAIQFGATTVAGVTVSTAFEIVNPGTALPAGAVQLVIADDNGNASTAMIQAVIDAMLTFRAGGIPVFVTGGTVQFVQGIYKLAFAAGIDTVAAAEEVRAAAVAIAQFKRPGETLLESDWKAAARAVPGVIVRADSLVAPVGDVVPASNNVLLRVRPQDVSFT
jgi:uncharacterized phage protein gp47/JayE